MHSLFCFHNALAMWREALLAVLWAGSSMLLLFVAAASLGAFIASMVAAAFVVVWAILPLLMAEWCLRGVAACFWRAMKGLHTDLRCEVERCDENRGQVAADALQGGRKLLANMLQAGVQAFLGTALVLLSKLQDSSCYSPGSSNSTSQGGGELLPIVQRCLESLLVTAATWSFDGADTTHSNATPQSPTMQQTQSWHAIGANNPAKQHSHQPAVVPVQLLALSPPGGRSWSRRSHYPTVVPAQLLALSPQVCKTSRSYQPVAIPLHLLALSPTVDRTSTTEAYRCSSVARSLHFESKGLAPATSRLSTTTQPVRPAQLDKSPPPAVVPMNTQSPIAQEVLRHSIKRPYTGVYVGNLPLDTDERTLMELFSPYGCITKLWITWDPVRGASLGYGYVVYSASSGPQAAHCAVRDLDGVCIQQQQICVRLSNREFEWIDA